MTSHGTIKYRLTASIGALVIRTISIIRNPNIRPSLAGEEGGMGDSALALGAGHSYG